MENERFVNPYGFIPLPEKKEEAKNYNADGCHTGVISYSITTKTPLFIPNTSNEDVFHKGHKSYDFFSYNELNPDKEYGGPYEPVIPGSELRGMIRSIYETLTDSCMSVFNDKKYPERRTGDVFMEGVIRKTGDNYELYEAEAYKIRGAFKELYHNEKYKEGKKVFFRINDSNGEVEKYEAKKAKGLDKEGYLIKGMPFGKKENKNCYIFEPKLSNKVIDLDECALGRLDAVITSYQEQPKHSDFYKEYQSELSDFKRKEEGFFPVRYSIIPELKYMRCFSLADIMTDKDVFADSKEIALGLLEKTENTYELYAAKEYKSREEFFCCSAGEHHKGEYLGVLDNEDIDELNKKLVSDMKEKGRKDTNFQSYWENFNNFQKQKERYFPVAYKWESMFYLSPAAITKEIAMKPLKRALGSFRACETFQDRCPACDLFGMIGQTNEESIGGKLRFSDAVVKDHREPKEYYGPIITREILGSPKFSNAEFYLERPAGADAWNYDYYVKDKKLCLYTKENPLRLRGRKFYYHQENVVLPENIEKTDLNATIRPVIGNVVFHGHVFFENISDTQLKQLLWILNGGLEDEGNSKRLCYKLGGGKPLGFGSVELQVISRKEREVFIKDGMLCYEEKTETTPKVCSYSDCKFSKSVKEDFIAISTLDYVKSEEVSYPYVVYEHGRSKRIGTTVEKGFEWFQRNKGKSVQERLDVRINTTLPSIQEKYLETKYVPPKKGTLEKGQVIKGVVVNHIEKKLVVQFGKNKKVTLHVKDVTNRKFTFGKLQEECPKGSELELTYQGTDDEGHPKWKGKVLEKSV